MRNKYFLDLRRMRYGTDLCHIIFFILCILLCIFFYLFGLRVKNTTQMHQVPNPDDGKCNTSMSI